MHIDNIEEINDGRVVEICQQGNLSEFGRLYDKYAKKIYSFIYYKVFHKETAEDLTSQTFIKALDGIKTFDLSKGTFSSWLYRIARNNVIDHYRKKDRLTLDINDFWGLESEKDMVYDLDVKEKIDQVKDYLKELKQEQREIIIMRLWDGLSYKEISEIVGKSEAGCKMVFSRTISKLRDKMPLGLLILILLKF